MDPTPAARALPATLTKHGVPGFLRQDIHHSLLGPCRSADKIWLVAIPENLRQLRLSWGRVDDFQPRRTLPVRGDSHRNSVGMGDDVGNLMVPGRGSPSPETRKRKRDLSGQPTRSPKRKANERSKTPRSTASGPVTKFTPVVVNHLSLPQLSRVELDGLVPERSLEPQTRDPTAAEDTSGLPGPWRSWLVR